MHFPPPAESVYLDLADRAKLRLTGADRVRFLNGQVSNDVRAASSERSVYTGVMTIKGKLCGDAYIHAGTDFLLLDAAVELRETLAARLEKYIIADDVQIEDVTDDLALLHVIDFAADAGQPHLPKLRETLGALGTSVHSVESTRYGRAGLDLFFAPGAGSAVHKCLHEGFTELNADAAEAWRIIAGVPRWGAELDENVMPAEAGVEERAVSYTKGCYIGQEIVSRVKSVGHVNRHLRGLRALDSSPLYEGMALLTANVGETGDEPARRVGQITSAAPAAGHGGAHFIALAYVRRGWEAPGTVLDAAVLPSASGSLAGESAADVQSSSALDAALTPACRVEVCSLPFV